MRSLLRSTLLAASVLVACWGIPGCSRHGGRKGEDVWTHGQEGHR